MVTRLSTVICLLCMRRLSRPKSNASSNQRARRLANGLKMRTSILGWESTAAQVLSCLPVWMSSIRMRTRTPRSAASIRSPISTLPVLSMSKM
ncbi:hypothetical protein D3C71_1987110 [compost metagenome]